MPFPRQSVAVIAAASMCAAGLLHGQEVSFPATDGATVYATWYPSPEAAKAIVLAFHQGGASAEGEYGPIVERLNRQGYDVLAVDQRAGGNRFGGVNRTVAARGGEADYCEAAPDLEGAIAYARTQRTGTPLILWGSSFSGALVLRLASTNPDSVRAVLAFSPASGGPMVDCRGEDLSGRIRVPVLALRPIGEMALETSVAQFATFEAQGHQTFIADPGAHGSSMLVEERVGAPVDATWEIVLDFLNRVIR